MKWALAFILLAGGALSAGPTQRVTGLDDAGQPILVDPVTEAEYSEREAARPPSPPNPGAIVCRTEAELRAALAGTSADIWIPAPGITDIKRPLVIPKRGTAIRGPGPGLAALALAPDAQADRLLHPQAPDILISGLALSGGPKRATVVWLDGFSRSADRLTLSNLLIHSCATGVRLTGGPGTTAEDILEDIQIRNCRIVDWSEGGVHLQWELLRPHVVGCIIKGNKAASRFNALTMAMGFVDAHVVDCDLGETGRMGAEFFFAHADPTVGGQPGPSIVSKLHPWGPSLTFTGNTVSDTGSMGVSFAGCKRSVIGGFTVRNATGIGVEFVDELPGPSSITASGVTVLNTQGTAISIDRVRASSFSGLTVDAVRPGQYHRGIVVYLSDDVSISGGRIAGAGPRYLEILHSTAVSVTGSQFTARVGESYPIGPEGGNFALYAYGTPNLPTDVYFSGNIIRGTALNPLRTCVNGASVITGPVANPITGYQFFSDAGNYRSRR